MSARAKRTAVLRAPGKPADDMLKLSRLRYQLPPLLSVIAGMVDLIGFLTLGNILTAHITGNLVWLPPRPCAADRCIWHSYLRFPSSCWR
jgi:hypothetical protein